MTQEKINIAELLKDCPLGMELDCTMYDNVTLTHASDSGPFPIEIETPDGSMLLDKYGGYSSNEHAKCLIFPKGKTTWEGFVPPYEFKNENGRIKKNCIHFLELQKQHHAATFEIEECIAWLENQSEKAQGKSALEAIREEKVDNQNCVKPADKIEPKFKAGDRVTNGKTSIKNQDEWNLVPNKFDITTLKPFDKVLVRGDFGQRWIIDFFGFMDNKKAYPFVCVGHYVAQCIPYEGNEHLLGTEDDCDDFYKTWTK